MFIQKHILGVAMSNGYKCIVQSNLHENLLHRDDFLKSAPQIMKQMFQTYRNTSQD